MSSAEAGQMMQPEQWEYSESTFGLFKSVYKGHNEQTKETQRRDERERVATHTPEWWGWLWGSPPASLAQARGCRSHWWSPDSERSRWARCQESPERCSGQSPLQREAVGVGRRRERVMCVDMGTGHQRRKEGKTQKHVKQEELNMRQERKVKH